MTARLNLESLDRRDVPSATVGHPTEAFSWAVVNDLRQAPADFADRLDAFRRGTAGAFGFPKNDPVVADLRRLLTYATYPAHYGQALNRLRGTSPSGPLGWDDLLGSRAEVHNDWMRAHAFEHTGQDRPNKRYVPGYETGYRGGNPDAWGYPSGRYNGWAESIGYTYNVMSASRQAYLEGRFGLFGFQARAALIDTLSYVLEVNSPSLGHLDQLLGRDAGSVNGLPRLNAVGMDLDFYESPFEIRDGLAESTLSTHRYGLYRPDGTGGYLAGLAFRDGNGNDYFDAGEGMAVTLSVAGPETFTETIDPAVSHGVYSRYVANGTYTVTATAADGTDLGTRTVTIANGNGWFAFEADGAVPPPTRIAASIAGQTPVRPTVTWEADPAAAAYQIRVTNRVTGAVLFPGTIVYRNTWTAPADLIPGLTYRVSVRPLTPYQNGTWGEPQPFQVEAPKVAAPTEPVTTLRPTISWSAVAGAARYQIQVIDASTTTVVIREWVAGTEWTPASDLVSGRGYLVRVRAVNAQDRGVWSPAMTLTIARPTLTGPTGDVADGRPAFGWTAIDGVASYEISIWDAKTGKRIALDRTNGLSWSPLEDLSAGRTYRWRVRALNEAGLGRWSETSEFRIV